MISNQDNYLFLKQLLVIIQAQDKGIEIDLNGVLIEPEQVMSMAKARIIQIEEEFTIPRFIDSNNETTIDFEKLIESVRLWQGDINTDEVENEALDLVLEVSQPDNLHRSVVDYPLIQLCIEEHKDNLVNATRFTVNNQTAIDAANIVDFGLSKIDKWIMGDDKSSLAQVIILLNSIQLIDEMFQFGNDRFIGC